MTFEEKVAFALRKMDEKIDGVNKNIKEQFATFAGVIEIMNRAMDDIEKARDLDRARISKLESILAGHEVSLINLGADPQPVEDEAVSETSINAPVAAMTDDPTDLKNLASEQVTSDEGYTRAPSLDELEDAQYRELSGSNAIRPPNWHA
jgi:hypothetical protein